MKYLVFLILFTTSAFAQVDTFNAIGAFNAETAFADIIRDDIKPVTMDLILAELKRQNILDDALVVGAGEVCETESDGESYDKKKTKVRKSGKVVKVKTMEGLGFELVFLAEANTFRAPKESDLVVGEYTNEINNLYDQMHAAENEQQMWEIFDHYIEENNIHDLSLAEQAKFASLLTHLLPYSDPRAAFQGEFNQGAVSTFTQFTTNNSDFAGICGDIHAAHNDLVKRINPNLEAYTMSYATDYSQHVISYVVDPDNPDQIIMTNYGRVEVKGTDGVGSLVPTNTSMDDVGERVRFFQYKDGKQDHVGTFRNDVGSFLYEMATEDFERGATPNDDRYSVQKMKASWSKVVTKYKMKEKSNGETKEKFKSYTINNDIIMFRGVTSQGSEMLGILHKRQKLRNVDEGGVLLEGEKWGSHGYMSTVVGNVNYDRSFTMSSGDDWYNEADYFKIYFVTGKRYIRRIVEKNGFKFAGFVGHELEIGSTSDISPASYSNPDAGRAFGLNTADGDYSTHIGFTMSQKLGDKNVLSLDSQLSNHIGLKNEPEIYSFSDNYFNKLKMTPNALSSNLTLQSDLANGGVLRNTASYVGTQMGGKFSYRVDYQKERGGNIYVTMSTPTKGISKNEVNVLPENYSFIRGGGQTRDLLPKSRAQLRGKTDITYGLPQKDNPYSFVGQQQIPLYVSTGITLNF